MACIAQCNAVANCDSFRYFYDGVEPKEDASESSNTNALCYLRYGPPKTNLAGPATINYMSRIARTSTTINPTSSSTSTSTSATATDPGNQGNPGNQPTTTTTSTTTTTTTTSSTATDSATGTASDSAAPSIATATPVDAWTIGAPSCAAGNPNPTGGAYTDKYGAVWDVRCGMDLTTASYNDDGTNGQGFYACAKACDNRPECNSFVYIGTSTSKYISCRNLQTRTNSSF